MVPRMSADRIRRGIQLGVKLGIVLVAYAATARIGLSFDALGGVATTVWPPTGIALAALVLGGVRIWPVIAAAAFAINLTTGIPAWAAAIIAAGNALEAVIGATLLKRFGFDSRLARLRDVLILVGGAALGSTIVSASFGLVAAVLAGLHPSETLPAFWAFWWVGDAMGNLLVAPLILTWATPVRLSRRPIRWLEAALLAAALTLMSLVVFRRIITIRAVELVRGTYAIVPLLIWVALRFEQRGTTAALIFVAVMAVTATSSPGNAFAARTPHEQLLMIQCYMAVTAISMLTLAAALAERRAAIGARDEFISIASHELKTPLTALKLRLESAARVGGKPRGQDPDLESKLGRAIVAANTTADRLVSLVDNLLDVSRLHAARLVLHLEPVVLPDLLADVAARLREHAAETGSSIELQVPRRIVGIWDRSRIEQVVTNLLTNAIKYGKGRPIALSAHEVGGRLQLRVKDAGIGISRADQSRIFRAFERVATGGRVGGLGLGLYIGQQIAAAHGGTLAVESDVERGATFILDLPLHLEGDSSPGARSGETAR
jgi:signal transduction histidine kinase